MTSVSLVAPKASVTVNTGSVAQSNRRVDRPKSRGVVITPISQAQGQQCLRLIPNLINQPVTQHEETVVIPKVLIKAVSKSSSKKDASNKTFTLRDVNVSRVQTYDQLKEMILSQLKADLTDDFDVGYYQSNAVVTIRTRQDIAEIWSLMKKGASVTLWCDGLKERGTANTRGRKRSKYPGDDSDEEVPSKKCKQSKQFDKDEKVEKLVSDLKKQHGQAYTHMQYRIWGEMINGGLYTSTTEAPETSMFHRAGSKEPVARKKSGINETISEFAKHMSAALSTSSAAQGSGSTGSSPMKAIESRSKCYRQLSDLSSLRSAGILTEAEFQHEKGAVMKALSKLQ